MKATLGDPILARDLTRLIARAVLVSVGFYFSAKLGLALAFQPDYVAVFWPPNTIILTALVLTSPRQWWVYLLAMVPAYFLAAFDAGFSEQRAVIFFTANVLEVLIAATALSRILHKPPEFTRLTEVGIFIVIVVMLAPFMSASVASIATFSEPVSYWLTWRVWFLGDSLAHLALTPVLLTWFLARKDWFRDVSTARYAEAGVLTVGLFAVSGYAFGGDIGSYGNLPALVYMPLPLLLWAAIRFGPRASCSAVFIVTVLAIWNAINGRGPFTALDPAGNVLSIQLFLMVISVPMMFLAAFIQEHKLAATALRASEERLALSVEGTSDGLWDWDIRSDEVYFSPRWAEILGYRQDELAPVVATFNNLLHPDDRDHVLEDIQAHLDQRTPFQNIEFRIRGKDGDYIWVRSRSRAVWGEDGQAIRMAGSITDITERKRAEEALLESEQRFEAFMRHSPALSFIRDDEGKYIYMNPAYQDLVGTSGEDWRGTNDKDFWPKATAELFRSTDKHLLETGEPLFKDHKFSTRDGERSFHTSKFRITDHAGHRFVGGISFDITDQKETEEQLHQAQKMDAVGQLTGGVAHEFNNLLMIILGNIEALESRLEKDDPLQSFASSAMKSALRGAELTQDLLAFSRKQRLRSGEVDLNGLVLGMQNLFQRTLGETILIETDLDEELWSTSADAGQIEAALLNFVLNARDAMPDGGTITLRTSNRVMAAATAAKDGVEPGDYVTLEVSDTGAGMTEEQIEHAFEPFYTTKEVGKGTGLGLSVAYGFAKQSGGCLEIESEPGQNTTIRLNLPRSVEAKKGAAVKPSAAGPATGSGKILVLEDDADVRALAVNQLSDLGYEIIEAEDGPSALTLLDEHPDVDLLFSDVVLPGGMSGPQSAVQAHHKHPDLKILFTSGYPEKDIEDLDVGGKQVAILGKPYRKAELAEAIAIAMNSG